MDSNCGPHVRFKESLTPSSLVVSTLCIDSLLMTLGSNAGGFCEKVIEKLKVFLVL